MTADERVDGFSADIVAAGIPYLGVPQGELDWRQRRERYAAVAALPDELRARYMLEASARGAARGRATMKRTRKPAKHPAADRFLPAGPERDFWVAELRRLGLDKGLQGQALWRAAKAYADADATMRAQLAEDPHPAAKLDDVDVQLAFHEAEARRWREAEARDRRLAEEHANRAHLHEIAHVTLAQREGYL